jgi:protein O-GlcNAc transferase
VTAAATSRSDDQQKNSIPTYRKGSFAAGLRQCVNSLSFVYQTQEEIWNSRSTYEAGIASLEARSLNEASFDENDVHAVRNYKPSALTYHGENDRLLQYRYGRLISRVMNGAFPAFSRAIKPRARKKEERLRVGALSAHFRLHSNWKICLRGWLNGLASYKDQIDLFGYHTGRDVDDVTAEAAKLCKLVRGGARAVQRSIVSR